MAKVHVKKGDKVVVTAGKDKGKKGKVLRTLPLKSTVIVEGVGMIKRHTRPNKKNQQGGIIQREAAVAAANVQLICPGCGATTRFGKRNLDKGQWIRVCKKCGADIDKS